MKRYWYILMLILLLVVLLSSCASGQEGSDSQIPETGSAPRDTVEGFYNWYLPARQSGQPVDFNQAPGLTSQLRSEAQSGQAAEDVDPFFCTSELPESMEIDEGQIAEDLAVVRVTPIYPEEYSPGSTDPYFDVFLQQVEDEWQITGTDCTIEPGNS